MPLIKLTNIAWVPIRNGALDGSVKYTEKTAFTGGMGAMLAIPWTKSDILYQGTGDIRAALAWFNAAAAPAAAPKPAAAEPSDADFMAAFQQALAAALK